MDPPDPHGGGGTHALTPGNCYVATQLAEALETPDILTPSQWSLPGPQGATTAVNSEEEGQQALNIPSAAENRDLGQPSKSRGITKPLRRTTQRPPGLRDPLRDISKQFQALTGDMEKAIEQQALARQQSLQGDLEALWGTISDLKAELLLRDKLYQGKISTLEQEVLKLRTELTRPPPGTAQHTQTPVSTAPTEPAHRPVSGAASKAKDLIYRPGGAPRAEKPLEKKAPSYAGVAALMAIRPGGQEWQVVPSKKNKAAKSRQPGAPEPKDLKPVKEKNKEARRLLFRREGGPKAPQAQREEIILALNRALAKKGLPGFLRAVDAGYTKTGAISVLLEKGSLGSMVIPRFQDTLVAAACQADPTVISVELPEQWYRVKVHGVPTRRYLTLGLGLAREEIELGTEFRLKRDPTWLRRLDEVRVSEKQGSTIVVTVGSLEEARKMLINGLRFGGSRYRTEHYWELGVDCVCPRCCGIGHVSYKACGDRPPRCYICAGDHEGTDHACRVVSCQVKAGVACQHLPAKCGNCGGPHPATACPRLREARGRLGRRRGPNPIIGDQHDIQALIPSSPGFAVVVTSQALQQAPEQPPEPGPKQVPEHAPERPGTPLGLRQNGDIDMGESPHPTPPQELLSDW